MTQTPAQFGKALQTLGLRRTAVRLRVLEILSHKHQPLTAAEILELMPKGTDQVTVYRTLNTLTSKKLLKRVRGDEQIWRYERSGGDPKDAARHEHAHFVCDECGTVECLGEEPLPPEKTRRSAVRAGYRVDYSEVLMHGACRDCQR